MLGTAVNGLDDLEGLIRALQESGKSHKECGVKVEDYDEVVDGCLWNLGQGLGGALVDVFEDAWITS